MKSEVFELGKKIGVIDSILNAKPTDGYGMMKELMKINLVLAMMNLNGP